MSYNLGTASGRIEINGEGAARGFEVAQAAAESFFGVIEAKVDALNTLANRLTAIGVTGTAGIGGAVKVAASFEKELSSIKAVSGATADEMVKVKDAALRIGKDTSFSASEAASAMTELIKAGLNTTQVLNGAADATVALAAAGEVSLPEAATIAANAMNNFNLSGEDMAGVADLIAGAANASAIDVSQFGMSLSQAGAVANIAGVSFDDLSVAIAEMGNAGIKGSDAGTSLKTFLTNLIPTTDKQIDKFKELGLMTFDVNDALQFLSENGVKGHGKSLEELEPQLKAVVANINGLKPGSAQANTAYKKLIDSTALYRNNLFDANGKIRSMAEIQGVLQDATKGMTKEQKLANLELLFGSDAIRAAAVLSENGAKGYNDLAAAMGLVGAQDVAATKLDNLSGSMEQLKGSIETALITIGDVFLPIVRKFVDGINAMVNVFNNLPSGVKTAIAVIFGLGSALSLAAGLVLKFTLLLAPLLAKFVAFRALKAGTDAVKIFFLTLRAGEGVMAASAASIGRLQATYLRFMNTSKLLIAISRGVAAAWALMTGPVGLVVLAIAALVAAGVLLYQKWQPFRDFIDGIAKMFMDNVMPVLQEAATIIQGVVADAVKELAAVWQNELQPALMEIWQIIQNEVIPAFQAVWAAVWPVIQAVGKVAAVVVGVLVVALFQLFKFIATKVVPLLVRFYAAVLVKLFQAVAWVAGVFAEYIIPAVIEFVRVLVTQVIPAIANVVGWILDKLGGALSFIWDVIQRVVSIWVAAWKLILSIVLPILNIIFQVIKGTLGLIWAIVGPILGLLWNGVKLVFTAIFTVISTYVKLVWNIIQTVWGFIGPYIIGAMQAVWNVISTVWGAIFNTISTILGTIWDVITTVFSSVSASISDTWNTVSSTTSSVWNAIVSFFEGAIKNIQSFADNLSKIPGKVEEWFGQAKAAVTAKMNEVVTFVTGIPGKIIGALGDVGGMLYNAGVQIITGFLSGLTQKFEDVKGFVGGIGTWIAEHKGPKSYDLKLLTPAGKWIMKGLRDGLASGYGLVKDEISKIANGILTRFGGKKISRKMRAKAEDIVASAAKGLNKQQKKKNAIDDQLKEAKDKLADLKQQKAEYAKQIADTVKDTGNIVNIFADLAGAGIVPTMDLIAKRIQGAIDQAKAFKANIDKLTAAGVDTSLIQQLVDAGFGDAGQVAEMLANATPEEIANLNALTQQLGTVAGQLGNQAASQFYDAGIKAAEGLVKGLQAKQKDIEKVIEALILKMIKKIKKELGIKSPSKVLMEIGIFSGKGLTEGLLDQIKEIEAAAGKMAQATIPNSADFAAKIQAVPASPTQAAATVTKNVKYEFNTYNPVAEPTSVTATKAMTRLAALGIGA